VQPEVIYAMLDGLFQQCLFRHVCGDEAAIPAMQQQVRWTVAQVLGMETKDLASPRTRRTAGRGIHRGSSRSASAGRTTAPSARER
jgi:hypothetical protein